MCRNLFMKSLVDCGQTYQGASSIAPIFELFHEAIQFIPRLEYSSLAESAQLAPAFALCHLSNAAPLQLPG
jgi:hypothetical protein